ncbi:hypothetical protein EVAR_25868_1 [Eumeta japonica]|uniref:Uncharacterized protein n=1 Tax=Eumeta variegata TaxID=151549 RepID=A0A4C1X960_EUMVA|nr:hypothetical protein EVAR_25868_1 [Eumeta japonica]
MVVLSFVDPTAIVRSRDKFVEAEFEKVQLGSIRLDVYIVELKSVITNYKQVYEYIENRVTTYDLPMECGNKEDSQEHPASNEMIDVRPPQPARTEARPYWFCDCSDGRRYRLGPS